MQAILLSTDDVAETPQAGGRSFATLEVHTENVERYFLPLIAHDPSIPRGAHDRLREALDPRHTEICPIDAASNSLTPTTLIRIHSLPTDEVRSRARSLVEFCRALEIGYNLVTSDFSDHSPRHSVLRGMPSHGRGLAEDGGVVPAADCGGARDHDAMRMYHFRSISLEDALAVHKGASPVSTDRRLGHFQVADVNYHANASRGSAFYPFALAACRRANLRNDSGVRDRVLSEDLHHARHQFEACPGL